MNNQSSEGVSTILLRYRVESQQALDAQKEIIAGISDYQVVAAQADDAAEATTAVIGAQTQAYSALADQIIGFDGQTVALTDHNVTLANSYDQIAQSAQGAAGAQQNAIPLDTLPDAGGGGDSGDEGFSLDRSTARGIRYGAAALGLPPEIGQMVQAVSYLGEVGVVISAVAIASKILTGEQQAEAQAIDDTVDRLKKEVAAREQLQSTIEQGSNAGVGQQIASIQAQIRNYSDTVLQPLLERVQAPEPSLSNPVQAMSIDQSQGYQTTSQADALVRSQAEGFADQNPELQKNIQDAQDHIKGLRDQIHDLVTEGQKGAEAIGEINSHLDQTQAIQKLISQNATPDEVNGQIANLQTDNAARADAITDATQQYNAALKSGDDVLANAIDVTRAKIQADKDATDGTIKFLQTTGLAIAAQNALTASQEAHGARLLQIDQLTTGQRNEAIQADERQINVLQRYIGAGGLSKAATQDLADQITALKKDITDLSGASGTYADQLLAQHEALQVVNDSIAYNTNLNQERRTGTLTDVTSNLASLEDEERSLLTYIPELQRLSATSQEARDELGKAQDRLTQIGDDYADQINLIGTIQARAQGQLSQDIAGIVGQEVQQQAQDYQQLQDRLGQIAQEGADRQTDIAEQNQDRIADINQQAAQAEGSAVANRDAVSFDQAKVTQQNQLTQQARQLQQQEDQLTRSLARETQSAQQSYDQQVRNLITSETQQIQAKEQSYSEQIAQLNTYITDQTTITASGFTGLQQTTIDGFIGMESGFYNAGASAASQIMNGFYAGLGQQSSGASNGGGGGNFSFSAQQIQNYATNAAREYIYGLKQQATSR